MATSVPRFWFRCDGSGGSQSFLHAAAAPILIALAMLLATGCSSASADDESESFSIRSDSGGSLRPTASTIRSTIYSDHDPGPASDGTGDTAAARSTTTAAGDDTGSAAEGPTAVTVARPEWLGRRPLPTTPAGRVVVPQTTPASLRDRRFATIDTLPPPPGDAFVARNGPVPADVLARSTWVEGCPVPVDELRYLTLPFWGFDGRLHTGELIVNADAASDIVSVFRKLHRERFPIEEMRVVSKDDLDAAPTGDGNNTTSFVCRPVTGGTAFSQHAYGVAIDINPFQNPYLRKDLLLPELSEAYLDRSSSKSGAIVAGDVVVDAFSDIGWSWGGDWRSLKDYQHFSANNR